MNGLVPVGRCHSSAHGARLSYGLLLMASIVGCGHEKSPLAANSTPGPVVIDPGAPDEILFQQALALFHAVPPDYAGAMAKFDQLLATYPDSPRRDNSAYLTGRCSYELKDYNGAITKLVSMRQTYQSSPFAGAACYFTGRSRFQLVDYAGSVVDFRASLAADPSGVFVDNAQYYLGRALYEAGQLPDAAVELAKVESNYPASTYLDNARYYLGRSYFDRAMYTDAIAPFQRVFLTAGSGFADNAQYYVGRCHYALLNLTTALADFQKVLADYPASQYVDNALYYEIRIYVDQTPTPNCASAQTAFGQLSAISPPSPEVTPAQSYMTAGGC